MNRAAYGDVPAAMMAGSNTIYGGASQGIHNMLSDVGGMVMPVGYMPPARVNVGFYGQYQQKTGFFSSLGGTIGLGGPGRGQQAADYNYNAASDFGERAAGATVGVGAALSSMGIGSVMGKVLGGGIVGSLAGGFAGMAAVGMVTDAVGQRREINNYLESSSYRFATTGSGIGDHGRAGFGSKGRAGITDMIRGMDVKDPFMSTEDLTMVLQQGTQKGMFAGTGDMDSFQKKFKELVDTVKVTTRTLNQSLDEAMNTIKQLKSVGVDPSQAKSIIGSADMLGKMAGRTGAEMLNIGLQGAEFFRGTGITMGIGAQATMMNLASVRAGRDAGQISNETVAQAGGEEALAMRMNASGLGFAQSQMGRGFGAAFLGGGGAANFNQGAFMSQMFGGGMGLAGLAQTAAGNLSSPRALIAYQANQEKFMSEAGKTFGGQGLQMMQMGVGMAQAQFLSGATGAKFEDSFRLSMKQNGMSNPEIETMIGQARGSREIFKSANAAAEMTYSRSLTEEAYRGNSLVQIGSKVRDLGKSMIDTIAAPASAIIDSVKDSVIGFTEEHVGGVRRGSVAGIGLTRDIVGGSNSKLRVVNLDSNKTLLGGKTAGKALDDSLTGGVADAMGITRRNVGSTSELREGEVIINSNSFGNGGAAINLSKEAMRDAKSWNFNADDVKKAQESGALNKVKGGDLASILSSSKVGSGSAKELMMAAYGTTHLTPEQAQKLYSEVKGTSLEKGVQEMMNFGQKVDNAQRAMGAEGMIAATSKYKQASDAIKTATGLTGTAVGNLGRELSDDAVQLIASAANTPAGPQRDALVAKAQAAAMHSGKGTASIQDAVKVVAKGMTAVTAAGNLATAQHQIKSAQMEIGSSRLADSLVKEAHMADMSTAEVTKVEGTALAIAQAKTPEEFMRVVDASGLKAKNGVTSAQILKNRDILKKVEKLGDTDVSGLRKLYAEGGLGEAGADVADLLRKGKVGRSDLMAKTLDKIQQSTAPTTATSAGGGVNPEGGASAAQVMDQQMQINQQILMAMSALNAKLGGPR